jgi:hypothetical protein
MRARRPVSTILVATVALVVGLCLGSAGTASAAGALTKGTVKKIAAQVVAKKAAGLRVAHAATADGATTVGGLTAAALSTTPTVYTISSVGIPGQEKQWLLPQLSPGTYDMRFQAAILPSANGTTVACGFRDPLNTANTYGLDAATFVSPFIAACVDGGAVHTVTVGENTSLVCSLDGGTFTLKPDITITVTLLNGRTAGSTPTLLP